MKRLFFHLIALCLLSACGESKKESVTTADSTATGTTTSKVDTVETKVLTTEDSAKMAKDEFENTFKKTTQILKSGNLRGLSEVIDPEVGLFLLYNGGGAYSHYQVFPDMNYLDTLGEDDPAVSRLKSFAKIMSGAKDNEMVVQYADDVKDPSPCSFKRRGTFAIDLPKPRTVVSGIYKTTQEMVGDETDPEEMKKLKGIEKKIKRVVILNIFKDNGQPYPETLYFSQKDGKWYLIGIDMIDCFAA